MSIGVWLVFGATFVGSLIRDVQDVRPIVYAILSLTVIRMVPVAISMVGSRLALQTVAFVGWFGPRGLASIVFGLLALDALTESGGATDALARTVGWTVLLSVVAHGLTANPLAARYGRWIEARQQTTDEQTARAGRAFRAPAERADDLESKEIGGRLPICQMPVASSSRMPCAASAPPFVALPRRMNSKATATNAPTIGPTR